MVRYTQTTWLAELTNIAPQRLDRTNACKKAADTDASRFVRKTSRQTLNWNLDRSQKWADPKIHGHAQYKRLYELVCLE